MTGLRIRWIGGLALVLAAALLISTPLIAQGQDEPPAPRVVETAPLAGEELALDDPVTFYFDQPMERVSVEDAFSVSPAVEGTLTWAGDSALTFTPDDAYDRATEYTFTIDVGATSADGAALAEPFELALRTTGYLEVAEVLPAPGSEAVDTDSVITVIFNRPVVPLVTVDERDALPDPLAFDPPVEGDGEWINTSIYLFTPADGLRGGESYTATVRAGLEDVTGGVLAEDYVWTFTTLPPDVITIVPENGATGVRLEAPVTVSFTQPMDHDATEQAFSLERAPDDETALGEPVEGTFRWAEDSHSLTFRPSDPLALGGTYTVSIDAAIAQSETGARLREGATSTFSAVPEPAIVETSPFDGQQSAEPYGGFTLFFAGPMDWETVEDKVIIDPEPWRDYDVYWSEWQNSFTFGFDTEPSAAYTITILPGMQDIYGNTIDEGMVVTYTTRPYAPELSLQAPGRVGLYSAYTDVTRLFATHRNIERIDLSLWLLPVPQFATLTGPDSWELWDTYTPSPEDLLRRWSVDVSAGQDERRYELLYISETGPSGIGNVECLGAPPPQVKLGDVALVGEDDPRHLNVRAEAALSAGVITQAAPGETFQIIGGPVCESGFLWWQVRLDNGIEGFAAEGTLENYFFVPLLGTPADPNAPAPAEPDPPPPLAPGVYLLEASAIELSDQSGAYPRQIMLVATANIALKFSQDTALAWVTDLESGEPVANVPVIFYNANFNPIGQATTGVDGVARAEIPHLSDLYTTVYASVSAGDVFGFAVSEWADGMNPWEFDVMSDYQPENFAIYLYTDRPIYRPDQPVYFKGILRDRDDVTFTVPDATEVPVKIYDDRGEIVYDEVLPVNAQGSFSGEFMLDDEAALGYYRISAALPSNAREEFGLSFGVAEYRAPEFQVSATPALDEVAPGDTIQVAVEATYFSGGVVSNARVRYSVLARSYLFEYDGPGYWSFEDRNYDLYMPEYYGPYGEVVDEGEGRTDAQGRFIIEVPADLGDASTSQLYTIEAQVTDESDQLVAARAQVIVHQGLLYVGLQPEEYVGVAGQENLANVLAVDWDSEPVAGQEIEYEVVERRWFSVQEEDEYGRTTWTWDVEEIPVEDASGTVTTDDEGRAQIAFVPPVGGVYKVIATTSDERGNTIRSSTFLWVSGEDFVNWRQENSNRIQLITDKDEYAIGDTAEVLIPSPWQGEAYALITIERGDILTQEVLRLETNSTIYELPIEESHAPNVFVSVLLVKGVDENNPIAAFRFGLTQLTVETDRLVMDLSVEPSIDVEAGEYAGPGDTVEYTITATDWEGTPVPNAEIGVSLTDLAVLTIAEPNSPNLLPYFYSERGISVRTSSALTISVDQATQTIIDTIKGGGGGFGEGGIFDVREEFVDTPLWAPSLITDADGQATISVTLPDNLTTWRLDARAVTTGEDGPMLVGQTTFDLLSTKPLLIRPVTPRFFVLGDRATLAAIVNNNTERAYETEVTLEGTGFALLDGVRHTQTVTVPAQGRARVDWPIEVLDVEAISAIFAASAGDGKVTDASRPPLGQGDNRTLPVYKYEVPETVGTGGTLYGPDAGSRTEAVALPRRFDVTQGELTVRLDRSLAAATVDGLDWLRHFPHECIEQVVSRFLPNAVTYRALDALGIEDAELEQNLSEQLNIALQRLYAQQKVNGGWGWFPQDDADPLVTAYALIGLAEARDAGYTVDGDVLARAAEYVRTQLITVAPQESAWRLNRQAFLLYALSYAGEGDLGRTARLFEEREALSLYAKAYLAMTFHRLAPDDTRARELVNDLNSALIVSATGAHWEERIHDWWNWNTNTRTTALGLMAMAQIDPDNQMIPNIVRWLMVAREANHWETTQETAWSVMALTEWMVLTGELEPDYTFAVQLNGETVALEDDTATPENVKEAEELRIEVAALLADEANRLVISRDEGPGNLYYSAHLTAYLPVSEVEPLDRGISVSRKYSLLNDPDAAPITEAPVGEPVQVTLTIIAPNDLHYVVVEDPIPAGADAVNPELETTSQVGTQPELSRERPLSEGWGWWWFSKIEMRDEKVVLYATYLPRGTYQFNYVIQPGLAGEYNVIPVTAQEFYFPDVYGRSAGSIFTITEAAGE